MVVTWSRLATAVALLTMTVGCGQETSAPSQGSSARLASWHLAEAPAPSDQTLSLLVNEIECASGQSAEGRIATPEVEYGQDAVVITIRVERRSDSEDCPGNPDTPYTLELREPVGARTLLDGGQTPPVAASSPTATTTPTASPSAEDASPTTDASACNAADALVANEESAMCLYETFQADDRELAATFATPEAVEAVFALGGYPTDDQWTFEGCGAPRETTPSSGVSCHYLIPGEVHPVYVEMAMREDFVVESVQSIG